MTPFFFFFFFFFAELYVKSLLKDVYSLRKEFASSGSNFFRTEYTLFTRDLNLELVQLSRVQQS